MLVRMILSVQEASDPDTCGVMQRFLGPPAEHSSALDAKVHRKNFMALLQNCDLCVELGKAMNHVAHTLPTQAKGIASAKRECADVKRLAEQGEGQNQCLCSGSLSMLDLPSDAVGTVNTSKIIHFLTEFSDVGFLKKEIGPIPINVSTWDGTAFEKLQRVGKDPEVHALCLLMYWNQSHDL